MAAACGECGLTPLIEVRSEAELARAVDVAGAVIGVNNRDLETLVIEPAVGAHLVPLVPPDRIAIYESGISSLDGVRAAAAVGADAVLIGSVLSTAPDPVALLQALASVERKPRG